MSQSSPNLDLPFLQPAQAQKHVTHNEALRQLDVIVQLRLQQTDASTPPAAPAEGNVFALGSTPEGPWAGQAGKLAVWLDGTWHFLAPQEGWRGWDMSGARHLVWDGSDWIAALPDRFEQLGIATDADPVNRLAVRSAATLLSHAGAGHQLKLNKAAVGDTASLLFQSNWDGHAEMGLSGQNSFSIKVSPDGSTWTEALRLDESTGTASGAAVQADAADARPGRLLQTGAFGLGQTGEASEIADIDADTTPAGLWRFAPGTTHAASLPAPFGGTAGQIRVERLNATGLRQTVWGPNPDTGIWTRSHADGGWTGWQRVLDQAALVGPVAFDGGNPSGAVIERGATAQGAYVRFADGTQICTHAFAGGASSHTWVFPVAFAPGQEVTVQALVRSAGAARIVTEGEDLSDTGVTLLSWDITGAPASSALMVTATGRWA